MQGILVLENHACQFDSDTKAGGDEQLLPVVIALPVLQKAEKEYQPPTILNRVKGFSNLPTSAMEANLMCLRRMQNSYQNPKT